MFNPQARWDRIPQQEDYLAKKLKVGVFFSNGKILPRFFIWNNKLYKVRKINYFWQEVKGKELFNLFALETNTGIYQISFSNKTFQWHLDKVIEDIPT